MEVFLVVAAIVFLIFGSLLLLSPKTIEDIARGTNKVLLTIADEKIVTWRRPLGIFFLVLAIFSWYVGFLK